MESTGWGPRIACDGKQFRSGDRRFLWRAVTYGTFEPRFDGARYPERTEIKNDLAGMAEAGFTVVRTYTPAPADLLETAWDRGIYVWPSAFWLDWRYLVGGSRRQESAMLREARATVRDTALQVAGDERVAALSLGNEVPADVIRWFGTAKVARTIASLAEVVREVDPDLLVTYANYPTAEYLPLDCLDFLTFNVYLERQTDFRRYLTRLQHLAGDRPLVLGEIGLNAGTTAAGEAAQAAAVDWQLETAIERGVAGTSVFSWTDEWWVGDAAVEGWHFGLTRTDRTPRAALDVATWWNGRDVRDLSFNWPSMSVVICAYNSAPTLDECLSHTCRLDYPNLEIIVVDDGSTDDTTVIAGRYSRAKVVSIEHAGLAVARNAGFQVAAGDLVAYLDSDAYPTPEWPYFLALALDGPTVGGVGGPNVPPRGDGVGAQQVAQAPGGPVQVLVADDRAEHIPGCNMAFWKKVLEEVGGCDPIYTAAGDDVDLCWKVLDRGWEIGFHPAALVWHHRRAGLRAYLRQQRGYGKAEALVEARHPDRFTSIGTARWHGRIYGLPVRSGRQRVYRGLYGAAAYQSVYQGGGHALDLAHQVGVPAAMVGLLTAPLAIRSPWFAAPALLACAAIVALLAVDVGRARPPRSASGKGFTFRLGVGAMHLLQPIVRMWGRMRSRDLARRDLPRVAAIPGPVRVFGRGLLFPDTAPRAEVAAAVVIDLRRSGLRVVPATGWEDRDCRILASALVQGDLVTSAHPVGSVQLRVRRRMRLIPLGAVCAVAIACGLVSPELALVVVVAAMLDLVVGIHRTGPRVRRAVTGATAGVPS
jgi:glycosyltransferase involved in cell wall biosynthesis